MTEAKHPTSPCVKCPYRKDAPLAYWDAAHFESVLAGVDNPLAGPVFACHGHVKLEPKKRGLCAGWLLDQKNHGTPSIKLRILLFKDASAGPAHDAVHSDVPMWPSAAAMARANLRAIRLSRRPR